MVIFAGDFNANGPTNIKGQKSYKEHLHGRVRKKSNIFIA